MELETIFDAETNPQNFWNILKSKPLVTSCSQITLPEWEKHFATLLKKEWPIMDITENTNLGNHDYCFPNWECRSYLNCEISLVEIIDHLSRLPNKKAAGPDKVSNECLKTAIGALHNQMFHLFNECFHTAVLPDIWKKSYIRTIYKGTGLKSDTGNYRGISLLSCTFKLFTSILNGRLTRWVESEQILPPNQYGFRKGKSTINASQHIVRLAKNGIETFGHYYACFIDFEKAFDRVDRNLLIEKLFCMGLHGRILKIIHSILLPNYQHIVDGDYRSRRILQNTGVPQGDKLSPLLFSVFIADCVYFLQDIASDIIFYADDLMIGANDLEKLQRAIHDLSEYCDRNALILNIKKTKVMKLRKGGRLSKTDKILYKTNVVTFTNTFCYLGVILSSQLSASHHLEHLRKKTLTSAHLVSRK